MLCILLYIGDVVTNLVDGRNVTNYHLFTGYVFSVTHNGEGQVISFEKKKLKML
jgi:hypothetical protein